jgi:hypothetical protein
VRLRPSVMAWVLALFAQGFYRAPHVSRTAMAAQYGKLMTDLMNAGDKSPLLLRKEPRRGR